MDNKPCPLCNVQFTTCIHDKRLQRTLNELQVYCCHEAGCEWVGELSNLPQHFNTELEPDAILKRLTGCLFVSIDCTYSQLGAIGMLNTVDPLASVSNYH